MSDPTDFSKTMKFLQWSRTRSWVFLTWLGAALVAVPSFIYQPGKGQEWMILLLLLGLAVGVTAPLREAKNHAIELKSLATKLVGEVNAASGDATVLYRTIMVPTMQRLHKFLSSKRSARRRSGTYIDLVANLLGETAGFLASDGIHVKVNYYRLEDVEGRLALKVITHTRNVNREVLDASTSEGESILRRTLRGEDQDCPDISAPMISGVDSERARDYSCFLTVTVQCAGTVFGMVSANADVKNGFPSHGMDYLRVVGAILAVAEADLGEASSRQVGDMRDLTTVSGGA